MPKKSNEMSAERPSGLASLPEASWRGGKTLHLSSSGAAWAWICRGIDRPLLAIVPNSRDARDLVEDAKSLAEVVAMPAVHLLAELPARSSGEQFVEAMRASRGEALARWGESGGLLAATPAALMAPISLGGDSLLLEHGTAISRSRLVEWLTSKGYERADVVWSPGQFTFRGGIVDLFDPKDAFPIRVEFFDDEIDTMRSFAPDTQRGVRSVSRTEIRALSSRRRAKIADMLPSDMRVVYFEPSEAEISADSYEWLLSTAEDEEGAEERPTWLDIQRMLSAYPRMRVTARVDMADIPSGIIGFPNFRGKARDVDAYCASLEERGEAITLVSESGYLAKWAASRGIRVVARSLSEGFIDERAGVAFITDIELSGVSTERASATFRAPRDWGDRLAEGQWVVHDDYGTARYLGSERIETPDGAQEYLVLEYAGSRKLKIPITHFHKISRYVPMPGEEPQPDRLKGGKWRKDQERAREQAAAAARYLVELYAKRETSPGHAFVGDAEQEEEFERSFPYQETRDQLEAIRDVDRDMRRAVPMDRLLVGDVGYGKTEVAMRAAAKCVFEGKQVALLAPTTLLAEQHRERWSARFDRFGARVEALSRFVKPARQREILRDTEQGRVDVLIGTHRLLGSDVRFRDLGLVIVDEEHRFGVMHKERLKDARPDVDVLMLSATPIPRSLQLSLSGLRDMSVIQTPPRQRVPVITASGPWSEHLVRSAVAREAERGGQVFYVYNRVGTIEREAAAVRRMFPKMRVAVAHGRIGEAELAETMERFAAREIDILVCTTIIESGLDIPRANTLIAVDSQDLGLAQMYQLRGRVGRRDEQAYALFLYPPNIELSKEAEERLAAISAIGDLGAGYELARRDLEIRGGGELVGTAQHGSAAHVGFSRYCDMLEEAILREKGEWRERTDIEIAIPCAIPSEYIPQESVRISLYRRLLWTPEISAIDELRDETRDRFGMMPKPLAFLFAVAESKAIGPGLGVKKVCCSPAETSVELAPDSVLVDMPLPQRWHSRGETLYSRGGLDALIDFVAHVRSKSE